MIAKQDINLGEPKHDINLGEKNHDANVVKTATMRLGDGTMRYYGTEKSEGMYARGWSTRIHLDQLRRCRRHQQN